MQVKLGDRIWMHYGPNTLVVGYILDNSPDDKFVAVSTVPYEEYKKMPLIQKASVPVNWFDLKYCTYLNHVPYEEVQKLDESLKPTAGFRITA